MFTQSFQGWSNHLASVYQCPSYLTNLLSRQIGAVYSHRGRICDGAKTKSILSAAGSVLTHVGNGFNGYSGDDGPATSAKMRSPQGMAIHSSTGDLYISDRHNNLVRMVSKSTGIITTVVGNGLYGYNGDGMLATSSRLSYPTDVATDPVTGDLYIADSYNSIIRLLTKSTGIISTIAGTGAMGYSGDGGLAVEATLSYPEGIDVDPSTGNLYIADTFNNVIRMITKSTGIITTIAGLRLLGYDGDGGPATLASLYSPSGIAVAAVTGDVYVADTGNSMIRMITKSTGIVTTIAGTGASGYSGDGGPATSATLRRPSGVAIDVLTGNIYISDSYNNAIRMITKSTGMMTTVAGTSRKGYSGDGGPAALAMFSYPQSVVIDASSGILYIADADNNVIRSVVLTVDVTSRPSTSPVARPPTTVSSIPTAAVPSSAGEDMLQ